MAVSQFSDVDEYGFKRDENFDYKSYENIMSNYYTVLTNRRMKWQSYLKNPAILHNNKSAKLKRYIRKGIPGHVRAEVWMHISGAFNLQHRFPELYLSLVNAEHDKEIVDAIKIDLPRTFPDNIFFEGIKHKLLNILVAFAQHNKEIGYCQGLNYIAGLILIVTKNEEWTFWLLKILVENTIRSYHTKTMTGLIADIAVLRQLLETRVPDVCKHLDNCSLPTAVITTKWFICLFAEVLPIETVLRVWDCLFYEGHKILFRVCLTLIVGHKNEILEAEDITALAHLFRSIIKDEQATNCHEFMKSIFIVPGKITRKEIENARHSRTANDEIRRMNATN